MECKHLILAINPGSTSTKIAVFREYEKLFAHDVFHDADALHSFPSIMDQLDYRRDMIVANLEAEGYKISDFDAFVGRGGGLNPCAGGTYRVGSRLLSDARTNSFHPASLGSVIADEFASVAGKPAFVVNPPDVDELTPVARITGLKDVYRESRFHALSHKEVGRRAAKELGKKYGEVNLIVAHIGGGISVGAHRKGKIIDTNDLMNGDCPMAPTRAGTLAPGQIVNMCYSGKYSQDDMRALILKNGGFVSHFGTSDVLEILKMADEGSGKAALVFDSMIYQIGKQIGSFAAVLHGEVDGIVLTGGIARSELLVERLKKMTGFLADFIVYPGELEMEALAAGACRALSGEVEAGEYSGDPVWTGYENYKGDDSGI